MIHIPGKRNGGPDALSRAGSHEEKFAMTEPSTEQVCYMEDECYASVGNEEQMPILNRRGVMAAIRSVLDPSFTSPTVEIDASNELLASMTVEVRSVDWDRVKKVSGQDTSSKLLVVWISEGCPGPIGDLPETLRQFWRVRDGLRLVDGVAMYGDRTVIPDQLKKDVLAVLHSAHQGVTGMNLRAEQSVFWPGITKDIVDVRDNCYSCHKNAPSQAKLPPVTPLVPQYPFEHICMDYMSLHGQNFGVFVDRFTGWPGVYVGGCASDVVTVLSRICEDYGVPRTCTTDGGPPYTSSTVQTMMSTYGIAHRLCSVGNPHANCRAELGVKTVKRMIRNNLTMTGKLDRVKFSRALLTYRNTPDRDTGLSPAVALFNRQLRDFLPTAPLVGNMWKELADAREKALAPRSTKQREKWSAGVRELPPLQVGDAVFIQNQIGNHPLKWDKRGKVVEVKEFDQYVVMVDGSRRVTLRNRRYLRKYTPFQCKPFSANSVPDYIPHVGGDAAQVRVAPGAEGVNAGNVDDTGQAVGRDGHVPLQPTYAQVVANPSRAIVTPALREEPAPALNRVFGPDMESGNGRAATQSGQASSPGMDVGVNKNETPVRRSSRANKGKTKQFIDYELGSFRNN